MSQRLFLLDGNALLHRAWHALPPLTSPKGVVVNALYGVLMAVLKVVDRESPDAFVACWDLEGPTFRHEAFAEYKAQREKKEDELYAQIPLIQEGLALMGVPSHMVPGFEADDVIGTLARRAEAAGWDVVVLTGDRDLLQLVSDRISVRLFRKGISETDEVTPATIQTQFGLTPEQIIEYKILRGDASDNIPGVKGIGEKGAKELLATYGTVQGAVEAAQDASSSMSARQRSALLEGRGDLEGLRSLVTIRTDVPVDYVLAPMALDRTNEAFLTFLREYGFKTLLTKSDSKSSRPTKPATMASAEADVQMDLHPVVSEAPTLAQVLEWVDEHTSPLAVLFTPSGGTIPADLWLCSADQQVLHVLPDAWKDREALLASLRDRLEQGWFHDAKRTMHALAQEGLLLTSVGFDCQIAAYVLEANAGEQSLEDLAMRYANRDGLIGAEAVAFIHELSRMLQGRLREAGLEALYARFEQPLIPVLFRMEQHGIRLDGGYLGALSTDFMKEQRRLERTMEEMAGEVFNPASPQQLSRVLFEILKLPSTGIKRGKNGFSTAADALEKLRGQHPIIEAVEGYREVSKLLSTYIHPLPGLVDRHQRIHTTFHQALASTGRLSSTDPNLQNIPIRTELGRKIRKAFVSEPGTVLVACDYAQIDLRVAAALSQDQALIQAFVDGEDIHKTTAAAMWQVALDEVTPDQRRAAKAVNFGVLYGQGAFGLSEVAGVSFAEAKEFIQRYFTVYHRLRDYLDEIKESARAKGYAETFFGRRRAIPELFSGMPAVRSGGERMAMNMPIQGTTADLLKLAMIAIDEQLPTWSTSAKMILQVHDELLFEVEAGEVAHLVPKLRRCMETIVELGVPLKVEAKQGTNWEEMSEIKR
jgi:DNA polymerase-1